MRYAKYILCCALGGWGLLASGVCAAQQPDERNERDERLARALNNPAWQTDERGRVFRVTFPPHDRLVVDYGAVADAAHGVDNGVGHRVHAAWKTTMGLDFAEENIWWRFRHTFADVEYAWGAGDGRLDATVVRADYLRHDTSSFIVIPAERDLKVPAPFDIAVDWELGSFELREEGGQWTVDRVDVAEVAIPLDFIRDPDYRHRLAIGPAAAYRVFPGEEPWQHDLAPLTGAEVLYAWESDDGLYQVDLRARCTNAVTLGGDTAGRWNFGCDGRARGELIAFSINDQPISIPAEVEVAHSLGADDELSWNAWLGLRLSFVETP